jgi:hypothetical protein
VKVEKFSKEIEILQGVNPEMLEMKNSIIQKKYDGKHYQ